MTRRLILLYAAVAPVAAVVLWRFSPLVAVLAVFISHMLLLYPTLRPNVQWLGPVITRFETTEKEVWLTIDDGPDPVDGPAILRILEKAGARATFFVVGRKVRQSPDAARRIVDAGHDLANHSDTHPSGTFWCRGPASIAAEIDGCSEAIAAAAGSAPALFRAPVGMKNPFVHPLLARRNMTLIGWTARGFDTVSSDVGSIVGRLEEGIRPGAILLLHEGHTGREGTRFNPEVLEALLGRLSQLGYSCVVPDRGSLR